MGFWRGRHIDKVDSQGVRGKSIEDTIAVGITVEVVVEIVDEVQLNRRGPSTHDIELPFSVFVLLEFRRDVRIDAKPIEFSSSEKAGDSARVFRGKPNFPYGDGPRLPSNEAEKFAMGPNLGHDASFRDTMGIYVCFGKEVVGGDDGDCGVLRIPACNRNHLPIDRMHG